MRSHSGLARGPGKLVVGNGSGVRISSSLPRFNMKNLITMLLVLGSIGLVFGLVPKHKPTPKLPARTEIGYPVCYITKTDDILCSRCANKVSRKRITLSLVNHNSDLCCSACLCRIKSVSGVLRDKSWHINS